MLCLLTDVKARLGLTDASYDAQFTRMILAVEWHPAARKQD